VWWRGSTKELLDPIFGTARYLCDPSQYRDAHTQRQDAGVGRPNFRRQAPEEIVGSRNNKIQQSRSCGRSPRHSAARSPGEQQTPHQSGMGRALTLSRVRAGHDPLTVTSSALDPHQQRVGWVSPEQSLIEPEVLKRCAADRARDPPALHPAPQPRATSKGVCGMPICAGSANLRNLPDPHQSAAHSSMARLHHIAHETGRAT